MSGNVFEWCLDKWYDNYEGAPNDGTAGILGYNNIINTFVKRGGSGFYFPWYCRSACRSWDVPNGKEGLVGFRVVCGGART